MRASELAILIALLFSLPLLEARPEKDPLITPSFAKSVKSIVFTGGQVEIALRANAPVRGTKYLIRSQPSKGQLGEILTTEDGLATITYRHNAGFGIGADSFTYAVQSPGAAVSSRATVAIMVINRPPRLEAPSEMDFGSVPVGSSDRRLLTVRNLGGEKFAGRIQLSSPWESDMGWIDIPPGGTLDLPVTFSPDAERGFSGALFIDSAGGISTKLSGTGFVVLDVSPPLLKLQEMPDGIRSAKLTVANKTAQPVKVEFECPPTIRAISPLTIPAGEHALVAVEADAEHKGGGRSTLGVKEKRVSATVDLLIPPAPAHLLLDPATSVDFGPIVPGKSASREITMANIGGSPVAIEISSPSWILPDPLRMLLKPGERQVIRLEAAGTRPGALRDRIVFKSDTTSLELLVVASVNTPAVAAPTPASGQAPTRPSIDFAETKRKALRISEISQQKGIITIAWQDPNPDPRTYQLDFLQITSEASLARQAAIAPDVGADKFSATEFAAERLKLTKIFERASKNDKIVKTWTPLEKFEVNKTGDGTFEATFPAPPNQQVIRVRISSVLAEGSTSPVRTEIRIPLQQETSRPWPMKTIAASLFGLLAGAFLLRNRLRRNP
ncbi:MAG: hypothetical protein ACOYM3_03380 [Terrimicrobiaceae bacterium]